MGKPIIRMGDKTSHGGTRHLDEMIAERGVSVDYSQTINRYAISFLPMIEKMSRKYMRPVGGSWRMDQTYIKVRGT